MDLEQEENEGFDHKIKKSIARDRIHNSLVANHVIINLDSKMKHLISNSYAKNKPTTPMQHPIRDMT